MCLPSLTASFLYGLIGGVNSRIEFLKNFGNNEKFFALRKKISYLCFYFAAIKHPKNIINGCRSGEFLRGVRRESKGSPDS